MGVCYSEEYPESKKILYSLNKIKQENHFYHTINNYDENYNKIQFLSKNNFEKLGQMQQVRVDFIQEIREEINANPNINANYLYYPKHGKQNYNNYYQRMNDFSNYYIINDIEKILYYIIIMTLTLKSYLKRDYISNEFEKSLLELSILILKKKYNNIDLKLILYYLSRMFELLFTNFHDAQNYININEYLSKIFNVTNNYDILSKEEKYPFILTHIISLGEFFHNDYSNILLNAENEALLMKHYIYLIIKNYDFILKNYNEYKTLLMKNNKNLDNKKDLTNYDKNDLIQKEPLIDNLIKSKEYEDLNKISNSINYFFIIISQDTFTGKNIFYEFDNQLDFGIKSNNFENDLNSNKFKEICSMILFNNLKPNKKSSTVCLSFFEYLIDSNNYIIQNDDFFNEMIIDLYGKFSSNKIFLDKYSLIISRIFIMEKENYIKNNLITDKLYAYIYNLKYKENHLKSINVNLINMEDIYFFINLIKYISFYYKKSKNIKISYDILIYFTNFLYKIRAFLKKPGNVIKSKNNYFHAYETFNVTLRNFDYNKDDYYTSLNEKIQIPLSNFLSIYIILVNDIFIIKKNNILNSNLDYSIITTITYLEIDLILNNRKKKIIKIIKLLNIYIDILRKKDAAAFEDIIENLKNNLKLIANEIKFPKFGSEIFNHNIQFNNLYLKLIYSIILIILNEIIQKNSHSFDLIGKHKQIMTAINQYNCLLSSHFFQKSESIQTFRVENLIVLLSNGEVYNIQKNDLFQIINIIKKYLFNEEDDDSLYSFNEYRSRTLYQRDKNNEISIFINTNNDAYSNNIPIYLGNNYLLNDSFSQNSSYSRNHTSSYINMPYNSNNNMKLNLSNAYLFSEKVKLTNNPVNFCELNQTFDIISDKGSSNFNLKI